jgi:glutathione-specific gamma-glutamylcyclotransferase
MSSESRVDPMADAYQHVPGLRGRLTPAEQSGVRLTPEVLATWDARALALGRPADWRWSDEERERNRREILGDPLPSQDIWVYSYGSLMWDPGLHFAEVRLGDLHGYQRRFTFKTSLGRGCPENPALMLSLEAQGECCCKGLVFRIAADMADAESQILWRREMIRGTYCPRLLQVDTPQGPVTAVVFTSNPCHGDYVGELPLSQTAAMIAKASGMLGSNRHYVEQLAAQLRCLQIEDAYIDQLLRQLPE